MEDLLRVRINCPAWSACNDQFRRALLISSFSRHVHFEFTRHPPVYASRQLWTYFYIWPFFSSQNRKEIRKFRLARAGKNKGFWPKYLPLRVERGAVLTHRGLHRRLYITERGCTIQVIPSRKEKIVENHTSTRKQNQRTHRSTSKQIVFFT